MRTRTIIRTVHRWLGLMLGGLLVATAGSGTLLVFRHEIDRAIDPHLYRATPGRDVGLDRVYTSVEQVFPGRAVATVECPSMPRANGVYVAAPNRVGHEDEPGTNGITFFGHSFVVDPFGRYIAEAGEGDEILIAQCDPALIETVRRNWPFLRDRRIDAYGPILSRYLGA